MRLPDIREFILKRVTNESRYYSDGSKVFSVILKYITADTEANTYFQKISFSPAIGLIV